MTRTPVRTGRALTVVVALAASALLAGRAAGSADAPRLPVGTTRHVVAPGDTLWEIARARVGAAGDPRPLVAAIEDLNGLQGGAVRAGELILVPPAP
jgi:nucleoid-associated protein YgaU